MTPEQRTRARAQWCRDVVTHTREDQYEAMKRRTQQKHFDGVLRDRHKRYAKRK